MKKQYKFEKNYSKSTPTHMLEKKSKPFGPIRKQMKYDFRNSYPAPELLPVSNVLKFLQVKFKGINVLESNKIREGIKKYSDWPTIPQLYIKKEFVGGCDIVKEMFEKGELQKKLEESGINFQNKK